MPSTKEMWAIMYKYYGSLDVRRQICKYVSFRDWAFLTPKWIRELGILDAYNRNFQVQSEYGLNHLMNKFILDGGAEKIVQLYYSAAKYHEMPLFTSDLGSSQRKAQIEDFKANHWRKMRCFDLLIDIDAHPYKNILYAWHDARKLKRLFDKFEVCYSFRYSGSGFHFVVPGEAQPIMNFDPTAAPNIYIWDSELIHLLHDKVSGMIDSTTWDSRQLIKIPFTLAFLENGVFVSTEFNDKKQFVKFREEDYLLENYDLLSIGHHEPYYFNRKNFFNLVPLMKFKEYLEVRK